MNPIVDSMFPLELLHYRLVGAATLVVVVGVATLIMMLITDMRR